MALPTTGPISLLQIFREKYFKDAAYAAPQFYKPSISLLGMTVGSEFVPLNNPNLKPQVGGVNTESTLRPDGTQPHAMSEFRGYNEDTITTVGTEYYEMMKRQGRENLGTLISSNIDIFIPLYTDFPFDGQGPLFDGYVNWKQVDLPVDEFRGTYINPYLVYKQSGSGEFRNDAAVSGHWIFLDAGKQPILGENGEYIRWEIKPNYYYSASTQKGTGINPFADPEDPNSVIIWKPILFDDDIVLPPDADYEGNWSIDGEGTPSLGTGPNEEIIYFLGTIFPKVWYASTDDRNEYPALDIYNNRTKYLYYESTGESAPPAYNWMRWDRHLQVPSNASYLTFCYHAASEDPETWDDDYLQVFLAAAPTDPAPTTTFTQIAFKLGIGLYSSLDATQNNDQYVGDGWRAIYYDLSANSFTAGTNIRPHVIFNQSNVDLRNDVAISIEWVFLDENFGEIQSLWHSYDGYNNQYFGNSWRDIGQRSMEFVSGSTQENPEDVYIWHDIPFDNFNANRIDRKWNKDINNTPTSGTGPSDGVIYNFSTKEWEVIRTVQGGQFTAPYFYYESSGTSYPVPVREWFRWKNFRTIPAGTKYLSFCYNAQSEDGESDYLNDYLKVFLESDGGITPPPINFP
jgi:hypothetical protein